MLCLIGNREKGSTCSSKNIKLSNNLDKESMVDKCKDNLNKYESFNTTKK